MTPQSGRFIVFEGLDGAGTTTQSAQLQAYFTQNGAMSFATFEPTGSAIGSFIRRVLSGDEAKVPERAMALLFAADRLDHSQLVREQLDAGRDVVCDRYVFSSMAYQTLDTAIPAEWVVAINEECATPDVTFFLDVPVNVCLERLKARGDAPSVYEKRELLDRIAANYQTLSGLYERHFGPLVTIDGTRPAAEVFEAVVEHLSK